VLGPRSLLPATTGTVTPRLVEEVVVICSTSALVDLR
jgi:hypothetical protein